MQHKSVRLGDLLLMNGTLYRVSHLISLQTEYRIQLTSFSKPSIDILLVGSDYDQLATLGTIYYLGNWEENQALKLLYS